MNLTAIQNILGKKKSGEKIVALTAYDFPFAKLVDQAGVDIILVGDSVGMVCLGYESTVSVTMADMLHHLKAVRRAVKKSLLIVDMPFGSYKSVASAVRNAKLFLKQGGADGVKLEGGTRVLPQIKALARNKIPVLGHLGMTPQTASKTGYKVQGKTEADANRILRESKELEKAGVFAIVLECVPSALAKTITTSIQIPTIGIGAGPATNGQVLVLHDILGFESVVKPRFVRRYADVGVAVTDAVSSFCKDVREGNYPRPEESFGTV